MDLSQDFKDLLSAFAKSKAQYLLIGGYAVAHHARPRFTKDIDIWIGTDKANLVLAARAIADFGAPQQVVDALLASKEEEIVWFGCPPARVDILRTIPGVSFDSSFRDRVTVNWDDVEVNIICRADLILAKRAAGRKQDLQDADLLEKFQASSR